jgi:hypothetical protein
MASSLWRDREIQSVVLLVPYLLAAYTGQLHMLIDRAARLRTVETGNAPRFRNVACAESPSAICFQNFMTGALRRYG